MKRILIPLLIAALLCLCFPAAAEGDTLAFEAGEATVREGETLQTALIREGDAAGGDVTYTTSDKTVASVDQSGLVTTLKKGRITITAVVKTEKKTYRATMKVTVVRPVTNVTVDIAKLPVFEPTDAQVADYLTVRENAEENGLPVLLLSVKKKIQLTVSAEPRDASDRSVTLTSSDPAVFTTAKNTITGVAPGEAILTVSSVSNPEVSTNFRVLTVQPVTKLTVAASEPSVNVGGQITVSASVTPENATIPRVTWSSGDERILTVDANGTVTGVKRGTGRVIAAATDGSNIRANYSVKVVQNPESLTLNTDTLTIDIGRTAAVRATVAPANTDDKRVTWTSSDEQVATVSRDGKIKAVSLGECTITCTSQVLESVSATLTVHVQQPVKKVAFNDKSAVCYRGETAQLSWTVEPANASNPKLAFTSSNEKILTVDENGVVTGVAAGKATVTAVTTDGTKRTARIPVQVGEHVTGVSMVRKHAYIDRGETATAGATLQPKDVLNDRMIWYSSDQNIVTATGDTNRKMRLKGINYGNAVVTGVTEDGGYEASIQVTVGDFDKGLTFRDFGWNNDGNFWLIVRNDTDMPITQITATFTCTDAVMGNNDPVPINKKDGSNKVSIVWSGYLNPGQSTTKDHWKMIDYMAPAPGLESTHGEIVLYSYQIDNDWIKVIREYNRPKKKY